MKKKYKCTFLHDETEGKYTKEITSKTAPLAAKEFAEYAYSKYDMRFNMGPWVGDKSILVIDPNNKRKIFEIMVEYETVFYSNRV